MKKRARSAFCVMLAVLLTALCLVPAFAADADPAACEHSWVWVVDKQPTCADGYKHASCRLCGSVKNEGTVIPGTGAHNWVWVQDVPPSRYVYGKQHQECTVCHAVQNMNTRISPTVAGGRDAGHAILEWTDSIGAVFHNIIMQIINFFNGIH